MKKYFSKGLITTFILVMVFMFGSFINVKPVAASSMNICQLINLLINAGAIDSSKSTSINAAFGCTPVTPPVSTGSIVTNIGTPILALTYDSANKESQLTATFNVSVTAGNSNIDLYTSLAQAGLLNGTQGSWISLNSLKTIVNVAQGEKTDKYGRNYTTILAGQTVPVTVVLTTNPKEMFAGNYEASLGGLYYVTASQIIDGSNIISVPSNVTNSKTIIGETSPYITSITSTTATDTGLVTVDIKGERFSNSDIIKVDGSAVQPYSAVVSASENIFHSTLFTLGNHTLQLVNPNTGDSNVVGFTVNNKDDGTLYPTLSLMDPKIDGYTVTQNGVASPVFGQFDTTWCKSSNPNADGNGPFEFNWGDGAKSCSWFPAVHTYSSTPFQYKQYVRVKNISGNAGYISQRDNAVQVPSVTPPVPTPATASLTANGVKDLTVKTGDSVTYAWTSQNGVSATSNFTSNKPVCGGGSWIANTLNGNYAPIVLTSQYDGCVWTANYVVTGKDGKTVTDTIVVRDVPQVTPVPVPTPATASLTANGVNDLTVKTGDSVSFSWTSQNGVSATSNSVTNKPVCGGGPWIANTLSGNYATTALGPELEGCTWTVNYIVTGKDGKTVTDTITMRDVPQVAPVINPNPTNLSAVCSTSGTSASISWSPITGASYNVGADNLANGWKGNCAVTQFDGDICRNESSSLVSGNSLAFTTIPGATYKWWVRSVVNGVTSEPVYGTNFSCI